MSLSFFIEVVRKHAVRVSRRRGGGGAGLAVHRTQQPLRLDDAYIYTPDLRWMMQMAEEQQMAELVMAQCGGGQGWQEAAEAPGFAWDAAGVAAADSGRLYAAGSLNLFDGCGAGGSGEPFLGAVQDDGATGAGWQYAAAGSSEPPSMAGQEHHPQLHGGVGWVAADSGSEGSEMQLGDQDDNGVDDGKP
jgi:hypothetical protein